MKTERGGVDKRCVPAESRCLQLTDGVHHSYYTTNYTSSVAQARRDDPKCQISRQIISSQNNE
ncbi:hypothetical protein TSAR_001384 [Trichomalopsis sarcophagae]|uniref:Uncharacterized protein n=1 Tax=Trichomalopsis sarcophagae TaxID=543379 RepID=A0A232FBX3_9HYME|nr:hypothetical protein TSAR_001384 [Trichomalopsis sarcophagae]